MDKRFNVGETAELFGFTYRVATRTAKTVTFECVSHTGIEPHRYRVNANSDGGEWVKGAGDAWPTYAAEFRAA